MAWVKKPKVFDEYKEHILSWGSAGGTLFFEPNGSKTKIKVVTLEYRADYGWMCLLSHDIQPPGMATQHGAATNYNTVEGTSDQALRRAIVNILSPFVDAINDGHTPSPEWFHALDESADE